MLTILKLFWSFCLIGFTSFGGLSMIPLITGEMAHHGWMTAAEVSDIVAIAEMTPGPLGLNCATFAGMRVGGPLGALAANLGILTPTFTICAAAAFCMERVRNSPVLEHVMTGVRPACLGIICAVLISLGEGQLLYRRSAVYQGGFHRRGVPGCAVEVEVECPQGNRAVRPAGPVAITSWQNDMVYRFA